MEQEQFINELFALGEATRRIAESLPDPAISLRLDEIADAVAGLGQAEQAQSDPAD